MVVHLGSEIKSSRIINVCSRYYRGWQEVNCKHVCTEHGHDKMMI